MLSTDCIFTRNSSGGDAFTQDYPSGQLILPYSGTLRPECVKNKILLILFCAVAFQSHFQRALALHSALPIGSLARHHATTPSAPFGTYTSAAAGSHCGCRTTLRLRLRPAVSTCVFLTRLWAFLIPGTRCKVQGYKSAS